MILTPGLLVGFRFVMREERPSIRKINYTCTCTLNIHVHVQCTCKYMYMYIIHVHVHVNTRFYLENFEHKEVWVLYKGNSST